MGYLLLRCYNGVRQPWGSFIMYLYCLLYRYYKLLQNTDFSWLLRTKSLYFRSHLIIIFFLIFWVVPLPHPFFLLSDQHHLRNVHPHRFKNFGTLDTPVTELLPPTVASKHGVIRVVSVWQSTHAGCSIMS